MIDLEKVLPTKTPGVRQLRVAELIKQVVADIFIKKEIDSKVIENNFITVSHVKISPDLHNATIYITVFDLSEQEYLLKELNKLASKFRFLITKRVKLKTSPQVIFRYDDFLEQNERIYNLLNKSTLDETEE